jgi:hypothetical protein
MSGGREDENLHDHLFESMNWIGLEREPTHAGCFLLPPGAGFFITAGNKSFGSVAWRTLLPLKFHHASDRRQVLPKSIARVTGQKA